MKKRVLSIEERELLSSNYKIKKFEDVIESTRIKMGLKVYHSKEYNRKKNSNSYTVNFETNGSTEYCEILYFFDHENKIFAKINVFLRIENEVRPDKISGYFYETFKNLYNTFYSFIDTGVERCRNDIILVDQIKFKCIKINYKNNLFHITNVVYEYEHD